MKGLQRWLAAGCAVLTLALAFAVVIPSSRASASNTVCQTAGQNWRGGRYAGVVCHEQAPNGGGYWLVITCEYYYLWQYHTYKVTGNYGYPGPYPDSADYWSWASCGNHGHQPADYIIHMDIKWSIADPYKRTTIRLW